MNLGQYLFGYLQEKGSAELPGFGIFSIQKKSATLDEAEAKLLPPSFEVTFVKNSEVFNSDFSKYIAEKTGENLFIVQTEIKETIQSWNQQLQDKKTVSVDAIGDFFEENGEIKLISKNQITENPTFFGLEEISLKEIKENKVISEKKDTEDDYVFNKSILWIFLFIIPVGAIVFLAINYQDKIFGKKSFDISVETSTHRIVEKPVLKKDTVKADSAKIQKKDSLKISK
jgi:nucleoid DNA-binding protein